MFFRWIFGLPGAALVTALLFLAMAALIKRDAVISDPPPPIGSILSKIKDTPPGEHTTIERPKPIDAPPPVDVRHTPTPGDPTPIEFDPPQGPAGGTGPIAIPGGMQPAFKPQPTYPQACLARGAQGVVILEFDVTPEGAVVNPRIISSPDSCFNSAALRDVQRWKYPPRIEDGRAVTTRGVQAAINYQLTE